MMPGAIDGTEIAAKQRQNKAHLPLGILRSWEQQIPRLRPTIGEANRQTSLGMTMEQGLLQWRVTRYS